MISEMGKEGSAYGIVSRGGKIEPPLIYCASVVGLLEDGVEGLEVSYKVSLGFVVRCV